MYNPRLGLKWSNQVHLSYETPDDTPCFFFCKAIDPPDDRTPRGQGKGRGAALKRPAASPKKMAAVMKKPAGKPGTPEKAVNLRFPGVPTKAAPPFVIHGCRVYTSVPGRCWRALPAGERVDKRFSWSRDDPKAVWRNLCAYLNTLK